MSKPRAKLKKGLRQEWIASLAPCTELKADEFTRVGLGARRLILKDELIKDVEARKQVVLLGVSSDQALRRRAVEAINGFAYEPETAEGWPQFIAAMSGNKGKIVRRGFWFDADPFRVINLSYYPVWLYALSLGHGGVEIPSGEFNVRNFATAWTAPPNERLTNWALVIVPNRQVAYGLNCLQLDCWQFVSKMNPKGDERGQLRLRPHASKFDFLFSAVVVPTEDELL